MTGRGIASYIVALLGALTSVLVASALVGCESKNVAKVSKADENGARFGRNALRQAVVLFSKTPEDPLAYEKFANRVDELMPLFNGDVRRDAELRLCTLAIAPLQAGLKLDSAAQMKRFSTTIWPSILQIPRKTGETSKEYVGRLCQGPLALDCDNVIPERWPAVLNAKVWRGLKNRVEVAYGRCLWCSEDTSFTNLIERSRKIQVEVELEARRAVASGAPADWPVAGASALPITDELVVDFEADGSVTVGGSEISRGKWREAIAQAKGLGRRIAIHMRPEKSVGAFLQILGEMRAAGFLSAALVVRNREFPYVAGYYLVDTSIRQARRLGSHESDTVQVLAQVLEYRIAPKGSRP